MLRTTAAIIKAKITPAPRLLVFQSRRTDPALTRQDLSALIDLLAQGTLHPAVTTMPLAEAADAHRRLEARQVVGKLVLVS